MASVQAAVWPWAERLESHAEGAADEIPRAILLVLRLQRAEVGGHQEYLFRPSGFAIPSA